MHGAFGGKARLIGFCNKVLIETDWKAIKHQPNLSIVHILSAH